MSKAQCNVVVLIGGNGSNLQALIDKQSPHYRLAGVISHRAEAYGLERAKRANIATSVVCHQDFTTRADFEAALIQALEYYQPELIVLAGFMRILSPDFVKRYPGKILNIHPSLLPKYKGLNTHQRVLENNDQEHGVSIHFVTEELDGGPLVAQVKMPVLVNETVESLTQRVHQLEHQLYPMVVEWFGQQRLKCQGNEVILDQERLSNKGCELTLNDMQGMVS